MQKMPLGFDCIDFFLGIVKWPAYRLTPQQLDKLFSIALQQFVFVEEDTVDPVQCKAF